VSPSHAKTVHNNHCVSIESAQVQQYVIYRTNLLIVFRWLIDIMRHIPHNIDNKRHVDQTAQTNVTAVTNLRRLEPCFSEHNNNSPAQFFGFCKFCGDRTFGRVFIQCKLSFVLWTGLYCMRAYISFNANTSAALTLAHLRLKRKGTASCSPLQSDNN
jgi:hypothetical protein